jgi:sugar O-acyltransferase (sialic acid O-acetyltransferase NeuD family)
VKRLFIIGAGGFGRELESWLDRVPESQRDWRICGYLDDDPHALNGYPSDYAVLGDLTYSLFVDSDLAVLAVASPAVKRTVVSKLNERVEFFSFVPPGTLIGKSVEIGRGAVLGLNCMLTTNVRVGEFVTINSHSSIGHDVQIESYASLMGNVMVSGKCSIGSGAVIGTGSNLVPSRRIGESAVVGACAGVFRHVAPHTTVIGNPARVFIEDCGVSAVPFPDNCTRNVVPQPTRS